MAVLLILLKGRPADASVFAQALVLRPGTTLVAFSPYASAVLRLYLVFASCVRLGLIKRDANSVADLQYLFYTPFATGFASNDGLHERLFPAASGNAVFVSGDALRRDLQKRLAWHSSLTFAEWAEHRAEYGMHPKEFPDSPINEIWDRTGLPRTQTSKSATIDPARLKSINDDPEFRKMVDAMSRLQEESRARKTPASTPWPFGGITEDSAPM